MTTGERIKNIRLANGLTQLEFADVLKVTKTTICLWENNIKNPSPKSIKKILAYCKKHKIKIGE